MRSQSIKCVQCSQTLDLPAGKNSIACPHCGATLVVAADRGSGAPTVARKHPGLTDDDVLAFLGPAPGARAPASRGN
jgi:DNA-directed RNA polymerase subunit RPC12/RpoP